MNELTNRQKLIIQGRIFRIVEKIQNLWIVPLYMVNLTV